ncbi:UNVERIFIED_CONTAM: hypothetical protein GTU68_013856 [Idotea baltica]|nr:hypothetical protein [Idotea baltica]
MRTGQLSR